eukprot:SAG11_NODE_19810_length_458_cov_1.529248_1_plen_35_part_00
MMVAKGVEARVGVAARVGVVLGVGEGLEAREIGD